jgi:outer membrane protein assembly factor BamB
VEPPTTEVDPEKPETAPSQLGAFGGGCITFPDGLTVSFEGARGLLTGTPEREEPPRVARRGPIGELRARWAFDTGAGAPVTGILPLENAKEGARTLVCDLRGRLYCLDSLTGKLLWEREGALPSTPARAPNNNWWVSRGRTSYMDPPVPAAPLVLGEGRVLVPGRGKVECLSAESGRLVWRAEVAGPAPLGVGPAGSGGSPFVSVFVHAGRVVACDPVSSRVSALDSGTGKLLWEKELPSDSSQPVGWLNSGASLSGDRLLVYGSRTAILDADTGEIEWSFEPARVRRFPVKIEEPAGGSAQTSAAAAQSWGVPGGNTWIQSSSWSGGYVTGYPAQPQFISYLGRGGSGYPYHAQVYYGYGRGNATAGTVLAAPAVVWAAGGGGSPWQSRGGQPRMGVLRDGLLLLFNQSSLLVFDLDLPLKGRQIQVSGTFVGMAGRVACFLQQTQLYLVDTSTGQSKPYSLQEIVGGRQNARVGACVDGPHVYVTGPGGVACVNARAALRVAHCAWPELVAGDDGLLAVPAAAVPQSIQYYLQGTVTSRNNGSGPCMPMVDRVAGGVLYATPTPSRVVALEEALDEALEEHDARAEDW